MLEILHNHLTTTETPEMYSLYARMMELFEKYNLEDYTLAYEDLMISADGAFDGVSIFDNAALHRLTMQFSTQLLKERHIKLLDDAPMLAHILVLEFIKEIENTEYLEVCHDILVDEALDCLDKFAECMSIVTNVPMEESQEFLDEIDECVVRTMAGYFMSRIDLLNVTDVLDDNVKNVFREMDKFVRMIQGQEMRSAKYLFSDSGCIGLSFEFHFKQNQDYLLALPLEAMLYECIGFALLSENGLDNPEYEIVSVLGQYITDLDRLTIIQYELSKLLIQYRNEISSGVGIIQ